jgi:hypothetical protein
LPSAARPGSSTSTRERPHFGRTAAILESALEAGLRTTFFPLEIHLHAAFDHGNFEFSSQEVRPHTS